MISNILKLLHLFWTSWQIHWFHVEIIKIIFVTMNLDSTLESWFAQKQRISSHSILNVLSSDRGWISRRLILRNIGVWFVVFVQSKLVTIQVSTWIHSFAVFGTLLSFTQEKSLCKNLLYCITDGYSQASHAFERA